MEQTGYRYYSLRRPIDIGTYPKPDNNQVLSIENFWKRESVPSANFEAWGYIEYAKPLSERDVNGYELRRMEMDEVC